MIMRPAGDRRLDAPRPVTWRAHGGRCARQLTGLVAPLTGLVAPLTVLDSTLQKRYFIEESEKKNATSIDS
jgi:hypothetical protein